jgi:Thioesterase superfamily
MPAGWLRCATTPLTAPIAKIGMDQDVLTVEFKINFLRPAVADRRRCRAHVLHAGKTLVTCESEVYAERCSEEKMVATVTLAVLGRGRVVILLNGGDPGRGRSRLAIPAIIATATRYSLWMGHLFWIYKLIELLAPQVSQLESGFAQAGVLDVRRVRDFCRFVVTDLRRQCRD